MKSYPLVHFWLSNELSTMQDDIKTIVEQPEQLSVSDLRAWLSNFGQANKQHYEKNMALQRKQEVLRRRISTLEDSLGGPASRSRSSTPENKPSTWESPPKMTTSNVTSVSLESPTSISSPPNKKFSDNHYDAEDGDDPFSTLVDHQVTLSSGSSDTEKSFLPGDNNQVDVPTKTKAEENTATTKKVPSASFMLPPGTPPRPSAAKPSGSGSSPSIYRFEAVRPSPRRRNTFHQNLLQPPTPHLVVQSNDDDWEDDWADDFSEPSFPRQTTRIVGRVPNDDWQGAEWVRRNLEVDDEDDKLEENSLLETASVPFKDPRKITRSNSVKSRFPLWLCHKRTSSEETPPDEPYVSPPRCFTPSLPAYTKTTTKPTTTATNLFPGGVLTKNELDHLCRDDKESKLNQSSAERHPASPARSETSSYKNMSQCSTSSSHDYPAILEAAVDDRLQAVLDNSGPSGRSSGSTSAGNSVSKAISRWGGRSKKTSSLSSIEQKRRQLELALAASEPVTYAPRTAWQACPKTGSYKKKIVVEPVNKVGRLDPKKGMF